MWVEENHVHTFELEKETNMKKEEKNHFAIVLATYDCSNDWEIGSCDIDGGCENCVRDWFFVWTKEWWGAWRGSTNFWSEVKQTSRLWELEIMIISG